ncbi:hypothetical protein ANCCEY_09685 [Ancylostoma ceylanicum]|uniref:Uncharacterized protein n=2 Tax=Ancylostoma ceylanicum TaxID=53326 RepID=A0A0D6LJ52_9BILA|nr:hypothetical protein ANCCEY_09685 [Ancylostoma ceylanicum]EYC42881.1 hypothetical protein Y032_0513g2753 [Ancylostoma ceylanicum]
MKTVRGARWSRIWTCCGDRWKPIRIKTHELAAALVMSQVMVVRRLKSIGKARKLSRCVPHALMQYGMDRCADMSLSLHTLKCTHMWLQYPFTKDEQ